MNKLIKRKIKEHNKYIAGNKQINKPKEETEQASTQFLLLSIILVF